jgi:hypothetical protein
MEDWVVILLTVIATGAAMWLTTICRESVVITVASKEVALGEYVDVKVDLPCSWKWFKSRHNLSVRLVPRARADGTLAECKRALSSGAEDAYALGPIVCKWPHTDADLRAIDERTQPAEDWQVDVCVFQGEEEIARDQRQTITVLRPTIEPCDAHVRLLEPTAAIARCFSSSHRAVHVAMCEEDGRRTGASIASFLRTIHDAPHARATSEIIGALVANKEAMPLVELDMRVLARDTRQRIAPRAEFNHTRPPRPGRWRFVLIADVVAAADGGAAAGGAAAAAPPIWTILAVSKTCVVHAPTLARLRGALGAGSVRAPPPPTLWGEPVRFEWAWPLGDSPGAGAGAAIDDCAASHAKPAAGADGQQLDRAGDAVVLVPIPDGHARAPHAPPDKPPAPQGWARSLISSAKPATHSRGFAATRIESGTRVGALKTLRPGRYELHYYLWDRAVGGYHAHHVAVRGAIVVNGPTLTLRTDPQFDLGIDDVSGVPRIERGYFCGDQIPFRFATSTAHDARDRVALCRMSTSGALEPTASIAVGSSNAAELFFTGDDAPHLPGTYVLQYVEHAASSAVAAAGAAEDDGGRGAFDRPLCTTREFTVLAPIVELNADEDDFLMWGQPVHIAFWASADRPQLPAGGAASGGGTLLSLVGLGAKPPALDTLCLYFMSETHQVSQLEKAGIGRNELIASISAGGCGTKSTLKFDGPDAPPFPGQYEVRYKDARGDTLARSKAFTVHGPRYLKVSSSAAPMWGEAVECTVQTNIGESSFRRCVAVVQLRLRRESNAHPAPTPPFATTALTLTTYFKHFFLCLSFVCFVYFVCSYPFLCLNVEQAMPRSMKSSSSASLRPGLRRSV